MSRAKKEVEKNAFKEGSGSVQGNKEKKKKIFKIGVFTSKTEIIELDDNKETKEEESLIKKYNMSFFKIPFLYFDHWKRKSLNSF
jgi:hypothetical protein